LRLGSERQKKLRGRSLKATLACSCLPSFGTNVLRKNIENENHRTAPFSEHRAAAWPIDANANFECPLSLADSHYCRGKR
jgi:hypothetical protein